MGKVQAVIKGAKVVGKGAVAFAEIVGVKEVIAMGADLTKKGMDAGVKAQKEKQEKRKRLVKIPAVFTPEYRLTLEDATRWLEEEGLKVQAVLLRPNSTFKDCVEYEVLGTDYKRGKKVEPGTRVVLKYVDENTIAESKELFKAEEKEKEKKAEQKEIKKVEKAQKKEEDKLVMKEKMDKAAVAVKKSAGDISKKLSKKKKIIEVE